MAFAPTTHASARRLLVDGAVGRRGAGVPGAGHRFGLLSTGDRRVASGGRCCAGPTAGQRKSTARRESEPGAQARLEGMSRRQVRRIGTAAHGTAADFRVPDFSAPDFSARIGARRAADLQAAAGSGCQATAHRHALRSHRLLGQRRFAAESGRAAAVGSAWALFGPGRVAAVPALSLSPREAGVRSPRRHGLPQGLPGTNSRVNH